MKRILVWGIIGILTLSITGCNSNLKTVNTKANDENVNTSDEINATESDKQSKNINNSESESKLVDKKIALEDATDININIKAAMVTIKTYDGEEVKVTGELSESSKGIDLSKNGSEIEIVEESDILMLSNSKNNGSKFDILIPSKFQGDFIFKQGAGICDIEGLKVKDADITGGAGKLMCEDIKFDKLNLNSPTGETDLNLADKCGDATITGGVGKINIKMAQVGGNMTYKGGVGEADIAVPENSPVKFVKSEGLGKCNISAKTSSEETYTFNIKVGVGVINIHN